MGIAFLELNAQCTFIGRNQPYKKKEENKKKTRIGRAEPYKALLILPFFTT
jgi:hypothetical protein